MNKSEMSLGFKLMSAYYTGAINKKEYSQLPDSCEIDWESLSFEKKLMSIKKQLLKIPMFQYWSSWNKSLLSLSSEVVAITFLIGLIKDWEFKKEPKPSSTLHKQFQMNSIILFDQLIYESLTNYWNGSIESKFKKSINRIININTHEDEDGSLKPLTNDVWKSLLEELNDKGTINERDVSSNKNVSKEVKLLLLYYYSMLKIKFPNEQYEEFNYDHTIPKSNILGHHNKFAKTHMSNLFNIAALPHHDNKKKKDIPLSEITDEWLCTQIETYAEIPKSDFELYSHPSDMERLRDFRGKKMIAAFLEHRDKLIN